MKFLHGLILIAILASCGDDPVRFEGFETWDEYQSCVMDDPSYPPALDADKIDLSDDCRATSGWYGTCHFDGIGC